MRDSDHQELTANSVAADFAADIGDLAAIDSTTTSSGADCREVSEHCSHSVSKSLHYIICEWECLDLSASYTCFTPHTPLRREIYTKASNFILFASKTYATQMSLSQTNSNIRSQ